MSEPKNDHPESVVNIDDPIQCESPGCEREATKPVRIAAFGFWTVTAYLCPVHAT
jgi:hypothetical protein